MFDEARQLMSDREGDHPANLLKARELLAGITGGSDETEANILLAETLFWLGDYADEDKAKEAYFREGVEHGKKAAAARDDSVAAHLWYAANMGSHGVVRGIMSSLFYLTPIEKHGKRAMELDADYFHAAPLRLMGRFYHQAPGWPVGKGDLTKSLKLLETAVERGPDFLMNHLYLAEVCILKRKKERARELLERVIATDPDLFPVYQARVQDQARALLRKV